MNAIDYATDPRAAALSVLATVRALLSPFGYDQHPNHAWREDGVLTPEGERQAQQALDLCRNAYGPVWDAEMGEAGKGGAAHALFRTRKTLDIAIPVLAGFQAHRMPAQALAELHQVFEIAHEDAQG